MEGCLIFFFFFVWINFFFLKWANRGPPHVGGTREQYKQQESSVHILHAERTMLVFLVGPQAISNSFVRAIKMLLYSLIFL